jgi:two-component system, response regulator PdtaR
MHALIIEDEILVAFEIENSLEQLGYTSLDSAASEEKAVAAALQRKPDLITADVRLVRGSGISAVQRIWQKERVPVVFITGNADVVRKEMPDAVILDKPYRHEALRQAIATARALASRQSNQTK